MNRKVYLLEAGDILVEKLLYYVDWEGNADAPFPVDIAAKREGHPHHFIFRMADPDDKLPVPLCLVAPQDWPQVGEVIGQQRVLLFNVNIYYVVRIDPYDIPAEKIRRGINAIVGNILGSDRLGLDWVASVEHNSTSFTPDFEQILRVNMIPYSCAMASFSIVTYEELGHKPDE